MAGEAKNYNAVQRQQIIKLMQFLMPILSKGGEPVFHEIAINADGNPDGVLTTEWGIGTYKGNIYSVQLLLTKTFFEQLIKFNENEFERDERGAIKPRPQPLVPGLNFHNERNMCYTWIAQQQAAGKAGADEIRWHIKRVLDVFNENINGTVMALPEL